MTRFSRVFSLFLCLILIFSVALSPIRADAAFVPIWGDGQNALFSMFFGSGFVAAADSLADGLTDISNFLGDVFYDLTDTSKAALMAFEASGDSFIVTGTVVDDVFRVASAIGFSTILNVYKIEYSGKNLATEQLTKEDFVQPGTELYLPTQEMLLDLELLSAQQLIVDYSKSQVSQQKKTNMLLQNITYSFDAFYESFMQDFSQMSTMTYSYISVMTDWSKILNDNMQARFDQLTEWQQTINNNIKVYFGKTFDWLKSIQTSITAQGTQIVQKLDNIYVQILIFPDKLDKIYDQLLIFPKEDQVEVLQKPQIQVQVHDQILIVEDYATLKQGFALKLGWVTDIFDFLSELRSKLSSGTPPKVPIKLSAAESSYDWGTEAYVLDMSWYARYKPSVDTIISGIMWLCFGWAIYKRIPDILSGVGITVENATQSAGHVFSDRAERSSSKHRSNFYKR